MTTLLALDTATECCSAALLHDGRVTARSEVIPRQHAQRLLPMIEELLGERELRLPDVDALVFGRGPGAFTGVRIATGMVQGLAFAADKPVIAVSNLAALAQRAWREHGAETVAAAIDARMDEVYWGLYGLQDGVMQSLDDERVCPPEAVSLPDGVASVAGAGTGWQYADRLAVSAERSWPQMLPNAVDLITLALPRWLAGEVLDAADAQPVYLRDKVATPKGQA
ncbi:tRNA (adenosine(37)-N6)-threonylcarbamoyltransferase complex dimerization subunit type 1 TsaB [Halopseudomonas aestusnigri]|jgi:tRNA threonylcarbamoyladenosine biosynthesis protein TsaB|uniref:tRNA (adenosine(37)-N6)-threonylcarbamoyltransferase complex dimerization subunit type 1 TsaB n=1 Tax=Halopseudomonas TaxID=2901189 RepID=UPI000C59EB8D|nr:tRNA (adenosine(37)-N6)-threonylcarbamoyltransferase complex dimerization subunit type 1 TsaB [Halopseudomonas aestusnigri]MAK73612.1 tRNA (adenosine(37)-N6)-threonylcarbamoyltransferase complex dimerization subunit type 1 TsaB [Pseudomonadales bacterium]MEE2800307.1 tRNA (adenosine(37)-N6)-threonylcarbamoyltransferase complex dimerization subunit type 1 TsaB [Pseudomonadota bacterium]MAY07063.1 tRNA (adenosine(37)-N6)-threonylcarbamoyltransferase complex dimerization subunit type 1 TsaB [Pse|tara:strand:+ start:29014 stop:29688 length:675 start_codon:yes stop_codon:yes gene_type:complete